MSKLIKGCEIVDNEWTLVEQDSELPLQAIAAGELVILPARLWLTNQDALRGKANVGLWLDSHEEPATAFTSAAVNPSTQDESEQASVPHSVLIDCNTLPLIAVNFPVFSDGRFVFLAPAVVTFHSMFLFFIFQANLDTTRHF